MTHNTIVFAQYLHFVQNSRLQCFHLLMEATEISTSTKKLSLEEVAKMVKAGEKPPDVL